MTKVIGLTGSIAVGKSTVTQYLLTHGYRVLDADVISREALNKGTHCFHQVIELFDCLTPTGDIDRQKLGQIVFHDQSKKKQLEDIIHPYVINQLKEGIHQCLDSVIFLDIPLLYETHLEYLCDRIIVVYVDESTQVKRLMNRNQITEYDALHLVHQQMSIEEKKKKADWIIDNRLSYEELYQNIERVLRVIQDEVIHE